MLRIARIESSTAQSDVELELNLDGDGYSDVQTGREFLDRSLSLLAMHAGIDLTVRAVGRLGAGPLRIVEDVGACLGTAVREAIRGGAWSHRSAHFAVSMEGTLVTALIDLSDRPCMMLGGYAGCRLDGFDRQLVGEFWRAFAAKAMCNLSINLHFGRNGACVTEALFKAVGRALKKVISRNPRIKARLMTPAE